ncbi:grpE protein homolog, mitochondrial isoform X6 [Zootermopsis nevadensis]|uniref:grpE protein homolog, mitochondrial isoform X6 n=1 Tax=Zootermopsis nevadensis TaxID=136037 RepID=UPI000B8E5EB6|nr:grpE protein homolog, mitochondrial isoform X6 [Zootermopsis nevadensis]
MPSLITIWRVSWLYSPPWITGPRYPSHTPFLNQWLTGQRGMGAATSQETKQNAETTASEESENEKKLRMETESLAKEIDLLSEKKLELEDKYKRALADSENMRQRLMKQIEDAKIFGIQGFCKDLLEVADILGKATESVPKEEVRESNPHLKNLYEGLTMTQAELHKVFRRHGLIPINPIEEKFDPNFHEALFQQEVQGKDPGTIVVVSKTGYKLHERVIRPALVGVAKAP